MDALNRIVDAYRARGYEIRTGLNPGHFQGDRSVFFTYLWKDGVLRGTGGGLSLPEVLFLEQLARAFSPQRIFVIGNAFGWSTLVVCALFRGAQVVAIDNCTEGGDAREGLDLTRALIGDLGFDAEVVQGTSPLDVGPIVSERLGAIDFALVDGLHANDQQLMDYHAIRPLMSDSSAILFHDVIDWGMEESFAQIADDWAGRSEILLRTPSGMGICISEKLEPAIGSVVSLFTERNLEGYVRNPIAVAPSASDPAGAGDGRLRGAPQKRWRWFPSWFGRFARGRTPSTSAPR